MGAHVGIVDDAHMGICWEEVDESDGENGSVFGIVDWDELVVVD